MGSRLQICDVPDDVRRALEARAAARGQSLNSYVLGLLAADVARPSAREVFERAARRSGGVAASVVDALHEARHEREAGPTDPSM